MGAGDGVSALVTIAKEQPIPSAAFNSRRRQLCRAALEQSSISQAPVVFALAAVYERITAKYGERGIRYAHMEAGHAAQNLLLQAIALGLGAVLVGAFEDGKVKRVLNLSRDEVPLYLIPVGKR